MKIINYTDTPVYIKGIPHSQEVMFLPEDYKLIHISHDGTYLGGGSHNPEWTHLYILPEQGGTVKYFKYDFAPPDITIITLAFLSTIAFLFLIKIVQKLRSS